MIETYCPNCEKVTGHKRAMGWGTAFGAIITAGVSLAAIPAYPKRCIVCGCKSEGVWKVDPQTGKYKKLTDVEIAAKKRASIIAQQKRSQAIGEKVSGQIASAKEAYWEEYEKDNPDFKKALEKELKKMKDDVKKGS